jgi:hypothetical protein
MSMIRYERDFFEKCTGAICAAFLPYLRLSAHLEKALKAGNLLLSALS